MIVERRGRYKTVDPSNVADLALARDLQSLTDTEREVVQRLVTEDGGLAELRAMIHAQYEVIPPTPEEWLTDPFFGAEIAKSFYPENRKSFLKIHSGNYNEVYLTGSLGWGKSYLAAASLIYDITKMLCLRDPQSSYGLDPGTPIVFFAFSTTISQASKGIGTYVLNLMKRSPFFERFMKKTAKDEAPSDVKFGKHIYLMLSTEGSGRTLGTNAIGGAIDESDFQGSVKQSKTSGVASDKSKARVIYDGAKRRARSRFNARGTLPVKMYVISSKTTRRSMLVQLINEKVRAKADDVLVLDFATYHVKDPSTFLPQTFKVFAGTESVPPHIIESIEAYEALPAEYRELVEEVPMDFIDDFRSDAAEALADIAGIAVGSTGRFFKNSERIDDMIDSDRSHPFTSMTWVSGGTGQFRWDQLCTEKRVRLPGGVVESEWKPKLNPDAPRYVHLDMSATECATGIAVGHVGRYAEVVRRRYSEATGRYERYTERAAFIVIDFVLQVVAPPGGEIDFAEIRGLIYDLIGHGFNVTTVSTDSYQSVDMHQRFKERGIKCKVVSTDRTTAPYTTFKNAINEGRVSVYNYPILFKEMRHLELTEVGKGDRVQVTKPPKFDDGGNASKDVSDAVCCVVTVIDTDDMAFTMPAPPRPSKDTDANWLFGSGAAPVVQSSYQWE